MADLPLRRPRRLRPYGPAALLLDWEARIDPDISRGVHAYAAALRPVAGVLECIPAYASLLIRFEPDRWSANRLMELIFDLPISHTAWPAGLLHELPVAYGGTFGPDLAEVAAHAGITEAEVIHLHQSRTYLVYQLGFLPGFAFLGRTAEALHVPRKSEARTRVRMGSVGLAGEQTAVYPGPSPGGWQLIGCCPLPMIFAGTAPRIRLRTGDRVRFHSISPDEFDHLQNHPPPWPER